MNETEITKATMHMLKQHHWEETKAREVTNLVVKLGHLAEKTNWKYPASYQNTPIATLTFMAMQMIAAKEMGYKVINPMKNLAYKAAGAFLQQTGKWTLEETMDMIEAIKETRPEVLEKLPTK